MKSFSRIAGSVLAVMTLGTMGLAVFPRPAVAQAQRVPNATPDFNTPKDLKVAVTISGNITAKNPEAFVKEFGQVKCNQLKVQLSEVNPSAVPLPGKSQFPSSYGTPNAQVTGNHVGLGCRYSLTVPENAVGKKGYLTVQISSQPGSAYYNAVPSGWQNPMPVPGMSDGGRNFVLEIVQIK